MRILIVEDSQRLAESLRAGLRRLGHAVDLAFDGVAGLSYARTNPFDALILDLMLPKLDGLALLRELRRKHDDVYVLVLTARDTVEDRVKGLREGADDYLVKPFAFDELVARLETLGRRPRTALDSTIVVSDLVIDTAARRVTRAGREINLSAREYTLLALLATRLGETVSREEIEDHLYDERTFPMSNAVQSAISQLRTRLALPGSATLIHTRRGLGYVLAEAAP
jgi:DNA-binding response OmpR family regulator